MSDWLDHVKALAADAHAKECAWHEAAQAGMDPKSKEFKRIEAEAEASFNELHIDVNAEGLLALIEAFEQANEIVKLFAWLRDRVKSSDVLLVAGSTGSKLEFGWVDNAPDPVRTLEQAVRDAMDGLDDGSRIILPR